MARIGIRGRLQAFDRYKDAVPVFDWITGQLENTLNGQVDSTNLAAGGVATGSIAAGAVTAAKLAALSVTSAAVDSTIPKIATGTYVGDGTSNREINLGFRARYVHILREDNVTQFFAWGSVSAAISRIQTTAAGVTTGGATDFTGCSTNGFSLGSAAGGGTSNANGISYDYEALG